MAQYTEVTAPWSTVSIRRLITARAGHGTRRQMSEATTPGCSAYEVTPSPVNRRASSCVNSTLHSLETAYSRIPANDRVRRRSASKSTPGAS